MNHTTTEIQPLDTFHMAFTIGGSFCLFTSLLIAFVQMFDGLEISHDGSGIAILILLSSGVMLVNRGVSGRIRIRTGVNT